MGKKARKAGRRAPSLERNSRKILERLKRDGWQVVRVKGSHHQLKHPKKKKLITLPHPKKGLPTGTVKQIFKIAGWL